MGVACPAIVRLSADMRWRGKGSMGRPSRKGLGCGQGSITRASTLNPDGGLFEIPKAELIRGLAAQQR